MEAMRLRFDRALGWDVDCIPANRVLVAQGRGGLRSPHAQPPTLNCPRPWRSSRPRRRSTTMSTLGRKTRGWFRTCCVTPELPGVFVICTCSTWRTKTLTRPTRAFRVCLAHSSRDHTSAWHWREKSPHPRSAWPPASLGLSAIAVDDLVEATPWTEQLRAASTRRDQAGQALIRGTHHADQTQDGARTGQPVLELERHWWPRGSTTEAGAQTSWSTLAQPLQGYLFGETRRPVPRAPHLRETRSVGDCPASMDGSTLVAGAVAAVCAGETSCAR